MMTGDFFEMGIEKCSYGSESCDYYDSDLGYINYTDSADPEDLWLLAHALSMKF
jgi:hypothetical protein